MSSVSLIVLNNEGNVANFVLFTELAHFFRLRSRFWYSLRTFDNPIPSCYFKDVVNRPIVGDFLRLEESQQDNVCTKGERHDESIGNGKSPSGRN